jgi:cytoskeletal protein RodZ
MNPKNIVIGVIYLGLIGIIIWQQVLYNKLQKEYEREKVLFDANYGEVIRLKDDLGAYADSVRLLKKRLNNDDRQE